MWAFIQLAKDSCGIRLMPFWLFAATIASAVWPTYRVCQHVVSISTYFRVCSCVSRLMCRNTFSLVLIGHSIKRAFITLTLLVRPPLMEREYAARATKCITYTNTHLFVCFQTLRIAKSMCAHAWFIWFAWLVMLALQWNWAQGPFLNTSSHSQFRFHTFRTANYDPISHFVSLSSDNQHFGVMRFFAQIQY